MDIWSQRKAITAGPELGPNGAIEGWTLPGMALGAIIAEASIIDTEMVMAAARAMHAQTARQPKRMVPSASELRDTTARIAVEVVRAAMRSGAATNPELSFTGIDAYVAARLRGGDRVPEPRRDDGWEAGHAE